MDIDQAMRDLIADSDASLPFQVNNVRNRLDFHYIPELVFSEPATFIGNVREYREAFFCDLFNRYYSQMNPKYFADDPQTFTQDDFRVAGYKISEKNRLIFVNLPTRLDGSHTMCGAYAFTYELIENAPQNVRFYALLDTMYGWNPIKEYRCKTESSRMVSRPDTLNETLKTIAQMAFEE